VSFDNMAPVQSCGCWINRILLYLDHKIIVTYDFGSWSKSLISSMLGGVEQSASHSQPIYPQGRSLWYPLWEARWDLWKIRMLARQEESACFLCQEFNPSALVGQSTA